MQVYGGGGGGGAGGRGWCHLAPHTLNSPVMVAQSCYRHGIHMQYIVLYGELRT